LRYGPCFPGGCVRLFHCDGCAGHWLFASFTTSNLEEKIMSGMYLLSGAIAAALLIYLVYALVKAERF
jgi:K+-transporting ATPase KdpF subunit